MDHEGAPSPLLFPAPPCHLRIINSHGAGGQIRAITHIGQADKTQTLSVTLHDICFSFHFRPREKSTCFISSMGSTQDPPSECVPPFDTDGGQVTDCVMLHRRRMDCSQTDVFTVPFTTTTSYPKYTNAFSKSSLYFLI